MCRVWGPSLSAACRLSSACSGSSWKGGWEGRKGTPVEFDRGDNFTALAHPYTVPVTDVGVPDRTLGINAYSVGMVVSDICPRSPVRQVAVGTDVVSGEPVGVRLGHDQRRTVGSDRHAVRKASSSATDRVTPAGVASATIPGPGSPPGKSKPMLLT